MRIITSSNVSLWCNLVGFSAAILTGALFLFGAVVRGHKLRAQMRQRIPIGVIGAALLYFAISGLVHSLTR